MDKNAIKICFVAPNAYPLLANDKNNEFVGGAELQQVIVARGLARRGYDVSMICLNVGQPPRLTVDGITVYRAFRPHEGIPILRFIWPRLTSVWRCLKEANADVYYYRSAGMLAGVVAKFGQRFGKLTIFAAASNSDLAENTPKIRFARDRMIYEYGLRSVDHIVVQNDVQADLCRRNFGRTPIRIPNCYQPVERSAAGAGRYVLWVSTIRRIKRPELFLDVVEALPEYRFVMVGGPSTGDHRLYSVIETRAEQLGNLDFVGFVPYSEIGDYFDRAALFANTSVSEGFPNAFLQSWARGIPTVSFVDSGARVRGQPLGRIVKSKDEMISVISALMDGDVDRTRIGNACREYVQQNHSLERVLDLYEDMLRGIL